MEIIKVKIADTAIIEDILHNHVDSSDDKEGHPDGSHLNALLADDRSYLLAAVSENKVLGYVLAYRFPSLYGPEYLSYLYDIEVSPSHRRKGIGRRLVETLITHLERDGVREMWLGTATDNAEGQGLFSATGGVRSGETFNDYTYRLGG